MKQENLRKCITLIGPSSVGKSLLTTPLAKKLDMPYVSIDDLLVMIDYDMSDYISPDPKKQKQFFKDVIKDLEGDHEIAKQLKDPAMRPHVEALVKDFIKEYNKYIKLLGSLQPYYKIASKHYDMAEATDDPRDGFKNLAITSAEMLDKILKRIDQPIIISSPAPFGWNVDELTIPRRAERYLQKHNKSVDIERCKQVSKRILRDTTTVYLQPGLDYADRNGARRHYGNRIILQDLAAYEDVAKITVSVNGMFYDPKDHALRKREWFNARVNMIQERLKNKPEIKNICEQIIDLREYVVSPQGRQF